MSKKALHIHRIVLTGGPCAGKTSALAHIRTYFTNLGYRVLIMPEVATLVLQAGFKPHDPNFQWGILTIINQIEDTFLSLCQDSEVPILIIYDRGAMDNKAYMPLEEWEALLTRLGVDEIQLRDLRYDAVLHLVSAADGAPASYSSATNAARSETLEEALKLDLRTQQAWAGHGHLRIIDNSTDFDGKLHRVTAAISNHLGIPEPLEMERRFLVKGIPVLPPDIKAVPSNITQTYLTNPGVTERVRMRQPLQGTTTVYTHTIKRFVRPGCSVEEEKLITKADYDAFLLRMDQTRKPVLKTRHCFVWNKRHYELDEYQGKLQGLWLLEAETESVDEQVEIPPFVEIDREVTGLPEWGNSELARRA